MEKKKPIRTTNSTYSRLFIHLVFAVKNRQNLIDPTWEERLFQYITQIAQNKGQKMLAINGAPDHIHILISMSTDCRLSDLVREIKKSSNAFINQNKLVKGRFSWQGGFGAFSYSSSQMEVVVRYILNQKQHHQKKTFREEYIEFLEKFGVEYNEKYLFEWID